MVWFIFLKDASEQWIKGRLSEINKWTFYVHRFYFSRHVIKLKLPVYMSFESLMGMKYVISIPLLKFSRRTTIVTCCMLSITTAFSCTKTIPGHNVFDSNLLPSSMQMAMKYKLKFHKCRNSFNSEIIDKPEKQSHFLTNRASCKNWLAHLVIFADWKWLRFFYTVNKSDYFNSVTKERTCIPWDIWNISETD